MADNCFTDSKPLNPINQTILSLFGNNFAPSYNSSFQPPSTGNLSNEDLFQFTLPGGGKIKPTFDFGTKSIADLLAPMTAQLGTIFSFFGPLFAILDVIRAIIDIICALFNPIPLIAAIVRLFVEVLPPIIALYPPFASILLALNAIKLIIGIVVTILAEVTPIIDLIVANAVSITTLFSQGNLGAVDSVTQKLCTLFKQIENQIALFTPISFILELLDFFMSLGSKLFCASDTECCTSNSCPPIIINPATGRAKVISVTKGKTLDDIIEDLLAVVNVPLDGLEEAIKAISLGAVNLNLSVEFTTGGTDFLIKPNTRIQINTAKSLANSFGLVSSHGVGNNYPMSAFQDLNAFIADPSNINSVDAKATIKVKLTKGSQVKTYPAILSSTGSIELFGDDFEVDDTVTYEVIPDETQLLSFNLISLGCISEIQSAGQALAERTNNNKANITGVVGLTSLDPLSVKVGGNVPRPPVDDLNACLATLVANPTVSTTDCFNTILMGYINDLNDIYDRIVCVGASTTNSELSISKTYIFTGDDSADISLSIKDLGGNNLLTGILPTSTANVDFFTTFGEVGPVTFDSATSTYKATLSSTKAGTATITAAFNAGGITCIKPQDFNGTNLIDKEISVIFAPKTGETRRQRQDREYVGSRSRRR